MEYECKRDLKSCIINSIFFRSNDIHGQLENDDVPRYTSHARSERFNSDRPLHKWSLDAWFQSVKKKKNHHTKRLIQRKRVLLSVVWTWLCHLNNYIVTLVLKTIKLTEIAVVCDRLSDPTIYLMILQRSHASRDSTVRGAETGVRSRTA